MKEIVKKIVILFFILCVIFSTIDISIFQAFAAEVEEITEQQQSSKEEIPNGKEETTEKNSGGVPEAPQE